MITRRWLAPLALMAGFAACGGASVSEHDVVESDLEPLRTEFNADSGKVRAIFLASPT